MACLASAQRGEDFAILLLCLCSASLPGLPMLVLSLHIQVLGTYPTYVLFHPSMVCVPACVQAKQVWTLIVI